MAELSSNSPNQQHPETDHPQNKDQVQRGAPTATAPPENSSSSVTDPNSKKQEGNRQSWIAWPRESGLNEKRNKLAYGWLAAIVGPEFVYTSYAKDAGVNFWRVQFTEEEVKQARKTSQFALIHTEMVQDYPASFASRQYKETNRRTWIAWPHDTGLNHALNKIAYEKLKAVAGPERICISDTRDLGVNFWRANFLPEEAAVGKRIQEIAVLVPEMTIDEVPPDLLC